MILAAILVFLGIPLWLCVAGLVVVVLYNRGLRKRPGDIPVRVLRDGKKRWKRGHAVWVSDVFAWRASPASWDDHLGHMVSVTPRTVEPQEVKRLHRLGGDPTIAVMTTAEGVTTQVATAAKHRAALLGTFVQPQPQPQPPAPAHD